MSAADWTYLLLAINPIGGILAAIPWGFFGCDYPAFFLLLSAPPLAYVQVLVVDLGWAQLNRLDVWQRFVMQSRGPRVEKLLASGGKFWPVYLLSPLVGPALVMAVMRYANIPHKRVAAPIFASLCTVSAVVSALCVYVPEWFQTL